MNWASQVNWMIFESYCYKVLFKEMERKCWLFLEGQAWFRRPGDNSWQYLPNWDRWFRLGSNLAMWYYSCPAICGATRDTLWLTDSWTDYWEPAELSSWGITSQLQYPTYRERDQKQVIVKTADLWKGLQPKRGWRMMRFDRWIPADLDKLWSLGKRVLPFCSKHGKLF